MTALLLAPVVLSAILLAAHFLRPGSLPLALAPLALWVLVFIRRPWAARIVQAVLVLGMFEWIRTLVVRVSERSREGEPLMRLAVILGSVALFTAISALLFRTGRLRARYRLE